MKTVHNLDKPRILISNHLPAMARDTLTIAASTPDPTARVKAIDDSVVLLRKAWPKYFRMEP